MAWYDKSVNFMDSITGGAVNTGAGYLADAWDYAVDAAGYGGRTKDLMV